MARRTVRIGLVAVVVLLALVVSSLIALPAIVRRVIVWQVSTQTGRVVMLDAAEIALFRGRVGLRNLRVLDRDAGPLATFERLEILFRPRDLLRGHVRVVEGTLTAPAIRIVRVGPREFNVSDLIRPRGAGKTGKTGKTGAGFTVDRFVVRDGSVTIEDRTSTPGRSWRADGVTVDARDVSTRAGGPAGTVTVTARIAGGPLRLAFDEIRLAPLGLRGTLTARDVDIGLAALALPPGARLDAPRGAVDVTVGIEQNASAGSRIALDLHARNIELRRPGEDRAFLTAPSLQVTGDDLRASAGTVAVKRLALAGASVVLEDMRWGSTRRWQIDGIAFEARDLSSRRDTAPGIATGRAVIAGAEVSLWTGDIRLAPLEARATVIVRNIDVALVRLSLPPDLPVQPERGVINATVRVDHDGTRGTRLALDAGLSGIEVRRPAHFVTAPAVRVRAEDITLANGTVTVGRARVEGDRLTLEERTANPVRSWDVRDLAIEAKNLSSRRDVVQGVATLNARLGVRGVPSRDGVAASLSAWVTNARLDPLELHATTIVRNLDLGLLRLYLPPQTPLESLGGSANASVAVDYTVAGGARASVDATLTDVAARARVMSGALMVTSPSLRVTVADAESRGDARGIGRIELAGSGVVADPRTAASRVDLASLHMVTEELTWPVRSPARVAVKARFRERGELDATGTARLTAPLPTIAWHADLGLSVRGVDLAPVGEYVPMARGLGGRVRANVTATVAYAGTLTAQLRGDVGGGRFVLAEGGRTLLALRRIDVTGLDVDWPARVSVAEVRLREPFAHFERDVQGAFPLLARFGRPPTGAPFAESPAPRPTRPPVTIGQLIIESGRATIADETPRTPARIELPSIDLTARELTWPVVRPARIVLDVQLPDRGTLHAEGTVSEPLSVDLALDLKRAQIAALQPYFDVPATVRARLDANLQLTGPLMPAPRIDVRGEVDVRRFSIADGTRRLITVERLRVAGIEGTWPERISIDSARAARSWALLERDRRGAFLLQRVLTRRGPGSRTQRPAPAATPSAGTPTAAPPAPPLALSVREVIFEQGDATIIDGVTTPPAHIEVAGARLVLRDFAWPAHGPVAVELTSPTPVAGGLVVNGTVTFDPVRVDVRASLDGVSVEPAQPYLPLEGRVAGRITGDVSVQLELDPVAVRVTGDARLQGFRLNDGDRALVAVGRLEAGGLDVDWPRRIAARTVLLRRPRLLVERDRKGEIILRRVATPRWENVAAPSPPPSTAPVPPVAKAPPLIEIATFTLERAEGRFVDQAVTPTYAEEVSDMQLVVTGFTTAPGRQVRFTGSGRLGGGSFKLTGAGIEGQATLDLKLDLRDVVVPRANAYLEHFTGWRATRGSLDANAAYTLQGMRLDAQHELVVRGLEVASAADRDEVERRVGLPFGLLVSLLKNPRGEIQVAVPVSGRIGTGELDFKDAVWTAVRSLALRLLASPFSRVGSLFVSQDSKVQAVAIKPVIFETGAPRLARGMETHLAEVSGFLRATPAINVELDPVFTQADVDALKREHVRKRFGDGEAIASAQRAFRERWPERDLPTTVEAIVGAFVAVEPSPAEALRTLGTQRLELVRQTLTRAGGVDAQRLAGRVPRSPLIEAGGVPRVEFDLKP